MSERAQRRARARLILASASPRRWQLLANSGVPFSVVPAGIDERPPIPLSPLRLAQWAAESKARAVAARYPDAVVLAADTVVALAGRAYGKPGDVARAKETLEALSGRTHTVFTAVAVIAVGRSRPVTGFSRTSVTMRELSRGVIRRYLESGEPQDKAGAYAIQGEGRRLVRAIRGPFDNVVGMPMHLVLRLLRETGVTVPAIKADGAEHEGKTQRPRRAPTSPRRTDPDDARRARSRRVRPGGQLAAGHNPELGRPLGG